MKKTKFELMKCVGWEKHNNNYQDTDQAREQESQRKGIEKRQQLQSVYRRREKKIKIKYFYALKKSRKTKC